MTIRAEAKGLKLSSSCSPNVPARLTGDPTRLKQILINLLGNAIKFTETGAVHLSVELAPSNNGTTLQFSVKDTGIGIPPNKLSTIFDTFTQADDSTTRQYGGTGLGLAISKQLVRMMGGRIWVESALGAGSTFHFTAVFNAVPAEAPLAVEPTDFAEQDVPPLRVLMLEDSKYNAFVIQTYLQSTQCALTIMENGETGIAEFKRGGYDCILMDIQMPGMDGLEATRNIRDWEASHKAIRTPIIAMTAHSMTGDEEHCLEAGADHYLSKPVKKTTLLQLLCDLKPLPTEDQAMAGLSPLMKIKQTIIDVHSALKNNDIEGIRRCGHNLIDSGEGPDSETVSDYGHALIRTVDEGCEPERVRQILSILSEYVERSDLM